MNEFTLHIKVSSDNPQETVLETLLQSLLRGQKGLKRQMATLQEAIEAVKTTAAEEREEVLTALGGLKDEIQALKDQIANGSPVTEEQLAELVGSVESILTDTDTENSE